MSSTRLTLTLPSGQPLDAIGGLSSPHLPAHHPYKQPTTNLEVMMIFLLDINICKQKIANDLIHPWSTGTKKIKFVALLIASMKTRCSVKWRTWWISHLRFTCSHLCAILLRDFLMENTKILFICKFSIKVGGLITDTLVSLCTLRENSIKKLFEPC